MTNTTLGLIIPSKALLHTAEVINEAAEFADLGISFGKPKIDIDVRVPVGHAIQFPKSGVPTAEPESGQPVGQSAVSSSHHLAAGYPPKCCRF